MTHSDKAPTAGQVAAKSLVARMIREDGFVFANPEQAGCVALAGIVLATELAAKHAEKMPPYVHAADVAWDFRNGYHLKGQTDE